MKEPLRSVIPAPMQNDTSATFQVDFRSLGQAKFGLVTVFICILCRHAGEGGRGSRRPSCLSVGGVGGAKVPFLNAMTYFSIVNMIQRRLYKLKTSNIRLEKAIICMIVKGIAHDIPKKCLGYPPFLG